MKEELENLGIELAKLAKKHRESYITISYVEGSIVGNSNPEEKSYESIHLDEREVEKRCLKD